MATHATIGAGALAQAPRVIAMSIAHLPTDRVDLRREDARTITISLRAFTPPPSQPLPFWKRCLCCCCLVCEEIERLERIIEELELQLLEADIPIEQLTTL